MATKNPRVPVTMEPELFEQVEAYQYQYGITSLSKAIRQLVRIGISSLEGGKSTACFSGGQRQGRELLEQERLLSEQERLLLEAVRELQPVQKAALLQILEIAGESVKTGQTRE